MCGDVVFIHKQHGSHLSEWRRPRRQRQTASICTMYMKPFILPWNFSACKIFAFWSVHDSGAHHEQSNWFVHETQCIWQFHMETTQKKSRIKINSIWKASEIYAQCIWNASFIPVLKSNNSRIENDITSVLKWLLCLHCNDAEPKQTQSQHCCLARNVSPMFANCKQQCTPHMVRPSLFAKLFMKIPDNCCSRENFQSISKFHKYFRC